MIVPVILPWVTNWPMTKTALEDVLRQTSLEGISSPVFLVGNGVDPAEDAVCRGYLQQTNPPGVIYYSPSVQVSLATIWNRTLEVGWEMGATCALVVNNDVRLWEGTLATLIRAQQALQTLFISGVGVTADQFSTFCDNPVIDQSQRGGPDFSCFLITQECHQQFPFDEHFFPAYCEDLDYHRRLMLAGKGDRISSINLPFAHLGGGSGTLKSLPLKRREQLQAAIATARKYYQQKWGGGVNHETFLSPFGKQEPDLGEQICHVTTPDLQAHRCTGRRGRVEG